MSAPAVDRELAQAAYDYAAELARDGLAPMEIRQKLMEKGLGPEQAALIAGNVPTSPAWKRRSAQQQVKSMTLWALGMFTFMAGVCLFIGNVTGIFRTIPFAGYATMALGGWLMATGMTRRT